MQIITLGDQANIQDTSGHPDFSHDQDPTLLKITALKPALKNPNRVNIFVNQKFSFSLTIAELADTKLKVGTVLSTDQLTELQALSDFGKIFQRALEYAYLRPRSEQEIRDHLAQKNAKRNLAAKRYDEFLQKMHSDPVFRQQIQDQRREQRKGLKITSISLPKKPGPAITPEDIEKIVDKLKQLRVLDDAAFTRYYVENRNVRKGISRRRLIQELSQKGIKPAIIEKALSADEYHVAPRDDQSEIMKMITKKTRRLDPVSLQSPDVRHKTEQKLIAYLVRQGFSYELARKTTTSELDRLQTPDTF